MEEEVRLWTIYSVDVVLLEDLKFTNERVVVMLSMIREKWSGEGMKWVYDDLQDEVPHKHGVLVLVRTKWASLCMEQFEMKEVGAGMPAWF